jgi:NAD(P)-dependent dehydrogenase (short-subunit alcohol dehydrogenase family)
LLFAREGALVAVTARRGDELDALVEEITASGGTAHAFPADITDDVGTRYRMPTNIQSRLLWTIKLSFEINICRSR